eukprot:gnl/TRDRNA2_/TRDRNA2_39707_c0_seq1.p1 gnl/TRDRNA2_/TRDRNA2_39707_c0~~gnl/TRDRNA2_/TRDRNA2_39707_c0_seq1.p1  ORF type:complete len:438 (-),score=77.92 gnl/TRDRNA2_/TRDRNA2_39707_c0_seq1:411-1724(-)
MRRTVSKHHVALKQTTEESPQQAVSQQAPVQEAARLADQGEQSKLTAEIAGVQRSEADRFLADYRPVDCGYCTLSFKRGGPTLPGLACLVVRIRRRGQVTSSGKRLLAATLKRIVDAGIDFVATFDFRCHHRPDLAEDMAACFGEEDKKIWAARLKSVALLVDDNIFVTAAKGLMGSFIKACKPMCPFIICHRESTAEEFFQAGLDDSVAPDCPKARAWISSVANMARSSFVSITKVFDAASRHVSSDSSFTMPVAACATIASLAPLLPRKGPFAGQLEPTVHTLPNGDVRVIQSPPRDIVLGAVPGQADDGGQAVENTAAAPGRRERNDSDVQISPSCDFTTETAMKFECRLENMTPLVGAHFHITELVVDAEVESMSRRRMRAAGQSVVALKGSPSGCLNGARNFFFNVAQRMLGPFAQLMARRPSVKDATRRAK